MSLGISELVRLIGDENIEVQNVAHNMTNANQGKVEGKITFVTSTQNTQAVMKAAATGSTTRVGLILWFDADKLPSKGGAL